MKFLSLNNLRALQQSTAVAVGIFAAFGVQSAMADQQVCNNTRSTTTVGSNTYTYENYVDTGKGCMTLKSDGTFKDAWGSNAGGGAVYDYLGRLGLGYDMTKLPDAIGWFTADYDVNYQPNCSTQNSNSYMGVYGWMYDSTQADDTSGNNLAEWYIVDGWCNYNPGQGTTPIATINIHGTGMYDVVETLQQKKPSVLNSSDYFHQYFSVKRNSNTNGSAVDLKGTIDVSEHFHQWANLGLPMHNLREVSLLVEGYGGGSAQNNTTPTGNGSADFSVAAVTADTVPGQYSGTIAFDGYEVYPGGGVQLTVTGTNLPGGPFPYLTVAMTGPSSDPTGFLHVDLTSNGLDEWYVTSNDGQKHVVDVTVSVYGHAVDSEEVIVDPSLVVTTPTNYAKVAAAMPVSQYQFRALGTTGQEIVNVSLNGVPQQSYKLTTSFQTYAGTFLGSGNVSVNFINDDGITNGRDVRLDYLTVNGETRQTESLAVNGAAYANGKCGGGSYTEWLNCNGATSFGNFARPHTIAIRARGNAGGEHINLLINGKAVNSGWYLGTSFNVYTAVVNGDGDINVQFDNDGGLRDAVIDWVRVDNRNLRQAENMQYNTGYFANGRCGGGSYSEWMQCNGVIGFGRISDNFH